MIKSSERIGVRYMQRWEELVMEREEGRLEERRNAILELLEELGAVPMEIMERIMREENFDILKMWFKIAARVESLEEFEKKIQQFQE